MILVCFLMETFYSYRRFRRFLQIFFTTTLYFEIFNLCNCVHIPNVQHSQPQRATQYTPTDIPIDIHKSDYFKQGSLCFLTFFLADIRQKRKTECLHQRTNVCIYEVVSADMVELLQCSRMLL